MWEKLGWKFSAPLQDYIPYVISTSKSKPAGIVFGPTPSVASTSPRTSQSSASSQPNTQANRGTNVNNTGPNSNASVNNSTNNNGQFNLNNNTNIGVTLSLLSQSGSASVLGNTSGGNATSGNADSTANIINMIQSGWNLDGLSVFSSDLYGDIRGDLRVNTANLGPNSNLAVNNNVDNNLQINVNNNNNIENNVDLVATTGDATVRNNTTGGNATTGSANAIANILNFVDTNVGASNSFLGFLNIYGTLDGDILFPDGALETIISGTGPNSTVNVNNDIANNLEANITNNTAIANNLNAQANSGNATVANNTKGGNATSGAATTSVNVLNLTGREVVSENTLLVFINVLGSWVGVLMDAPGTNAAAIGGNVSVNNQIDNNVELNQVNNTNIANNINVTAESGDATVSGNTTGGNATTGDANAAINVANVVGSNITNTSWFGVLFINVFGSWAGSFGVDTDAGNAIGGIGGESPAEEGDSNVKPEVYSYQKADGSTGTGVRAVAVATTGSNGAVGSSSNASSGNSGAVLGLATTSSEADDREDEDNNDSAAVVAATTDSSGALAQTGDNALNNLVVFGIVFGLGAMLLFGNRLMIYIGSLRK